MKKIALTFTVLLFAVVAFSQVTLTNEFIGSDYGYGFIINTNDFFIEDTLGNIEIYDQNADYIMTIDLNDCSYFGFLSKNLFSTSGNYEYLGYADGLIKLYDETNSILFNFDSYRPDYAVGNKLFTHMEVLINDEWRYSYRIFSLGGSITQAIEQNVIDAGVCYPNPASDYIYIELDSNQMKIYNNTGSIVETIMKSPGTKQTHIDVSNYPSGIYYYNTGTTQGKFIVE